MTYSLDQVAAGSYTELKYTICFANQVQMAYNGMNLKQYINESMAEVGDLAFIPAIMSMQRHGILMHFSI